MQCNHSKSFHDCILVLTLLTGWACEGCEVTLAGWDIVPGYNTISTMGTLDTMAASGQSALCQIQFILSTVGAGLVIVSRHAADL